MAVRGGERLLWRSRNTREVRHQHLLFAHPVSLPVSNRNFLLCWNRNFSLCRDNGRLDVASRGGWVYIIGRPGNKGGNPGLVRSGSSRSWNRGGLIDQVFNSAKKL